jgi:sugar phosphate isomerase/epimerase
MDEKRIWIGNQTAPSATKVFEPFEYAEVNGFDAFEWFLDAYGIGVGWEGADLDAEARLDLRQRAEAHGIRLSVHAPWWLDPFEPEGYEQLLMSLDFALDLGAANLNVHLVPERGVEAFVRTLAPFVRALVDLPLQLSIENVPHTGPEDFNRLFAELAETGLPTEGVVGMCLDLGHANLFPPTRHDYLGFVDRLASHVPIVHLHLHENEGDTDSHLPLFTGPSEQDPSGIEGFVERMRRRGFSGSIILEQWPDPPLLLVRARDRLLRMFAADSRGTSREQAS